MDLALPAPDTLRGYINKTEVLLREIHQAMSTSLFAHLTSDKVKEGFNPFTMSQGAFGTRRKGEALHRASHLLKIGLSIFIAQV